MENTNKPYDTGLLVGRFQTFHKGHQRLVEAGLTLCDRLLILVGSAQECGTERNLLNIKTRIKMIQTVYQTRRKAPAFRHGDIRRA